MYHFRKSRKAYLSYPKPAKCQFCDVSQIKEIVEETHYMRVIKNRVFYDMWELRKVTHHLMAVPKRHVHSLSELTKAEAVDMMRLLGRYEAAHYNIYSRSKENVTRSVAHVHTHLIKTDGKLSRGIFFLARPYLFFKF